MCDTQVHLADNGVYLAKNSDREPTEPQAVVRLARRTERAAHQRTTYLSIDAAPVCHAVILSKPTWMWGAEMGVNEHGVAIGNEAVFTRQASLQPALLGMDLVRLALERADSAEGALTVITGLLERYGQGGPAGHRDRRFCYDNSFLIADGDAAWVLETAARHWVAKRVTGSWAISNLLTIRDDYDRCSASVQRLADAEGVPRVDFARRFDTRLMPLFAGSRRRRALAEHCLAGAGPRPGFARFAAHLRAHAGDGDDPLRGGPGDVCLHANGFIRRSQTTGSMVVRLDGDGPRALFTGTSAPCLSLFRPVAFDGGWSVLSPDASRAPLWQAFEPVHHRALFDPDFRRALRRDREAAEAALWSALESGDRRDMQDADEALFRQAQAWIEACGERRGLRVNRFWRRVAALQRS